MKRILLAVAVCAFNVPMFLSAHGVERPQVRLPDDGTIRFWTYMSADHPALAKTSTGVAQFLSAHPRWEMWYNPASGAPHRAWGDGIAIDGFPEINLVNSPAAGRQFIASTASVLRVDPAQLRLLYSDIAGRTNYQKYQQTYHDLPVFGAYIDLRVSLTGKVFMFGSDVHPDIAVSPMPDLGLAAARVFATAGFDREIPASAITGGSLLILPLRFTDRTEYHLAYEFTVTENADGVWDTFVDAHDGAVLWRRNLVEYFREGHPGTVNGRTSTVSGRVVVSVYKDSWLWGSADVPLEHAYVNVGGYELVTDADGRFSVDIGGATSAPVIARLAGPYARARRSDTSSNVKNAVIQTTITPDQELTIRWDSTNSQASERCVFYHMNQVRDFIRGVDPSDNLARLDNQMSGIVNINQSCNANWNGTTVNFFHAAGGCANTAEIADVIYHEYGHAINSFLYGKLGSAMSNGALSEATADINANMLRDDPRIGIGFMIGGPDDGIIRNSDNTRHYPEDIVNEIHEDGMILTGAVWDMRKAIGIDAARHLTHFAKYGTPDAGTAGEAFADYFIEILVADDDNADLSDGTPHSADIVPAFVKHGIPASGIQLTHVPLSDQDSVTQPYRVQGSAFVSKSIRAGAMFIADIRVVYSTDNWATSASFPLNINVSTDNFFGDFPPQRAGSIVRYYIEVTDNFGSVSMFPRSGQSGAWLFLVGYLSRVYYDCGAQDGWRVVSDATTGQWVRAKPVGTWNTQLGSPPAVPYVQPNEDHTPGTGGGADVCWVTGNALPGDALGTNDVDDGATYLFTRSYDVSQMIDPVLRYYRWYSNDAGATPGTDWWTVKLSSDGGSSWQNIERTKQSNASWTAMVFRLRDLINLSDQMQVEFIAADEDSGSLVEAAIDDFEILDVNQALEVRRLDDRPRSFSLAQNYPNPFNPGTTIRYSLPERGFVRLAIYSPVGTLVRELVHEVQDAGSYLAGFDASSLSSGAYTCVLETGRLRATRTMILTK